MKDYQDVVNDRFDKEEDEGLSIYAPTHPIGKYSRKKLFGALDEFLIELKKSHSNFQDIALLDLGCGNGGMIEQFILKGFKEQNIIGIDLSKKRIELAQKKFPKVTFRAENGLTFKEEKVFNLITAFDLYSHIPDAKSIIEGLINVNAHLEENGFFLWFDICSKDHYNSQKGNDSWGFSNKQMIDLADKAGFKLVWEKKIFKKFFGKYHSLYQVQRVGAELVAFLEKVLPGSPGNYMMVFKKN